MQGKESVDNISVLVMAVERLAESQSDTNRKVDKLIESMGKQEVILEKLANIEKSHGDSMKRVYHVIDEVKERVTNIEHTQHGGGCPSFQKFVTGHDNELKHNLEKIKSCEDFKKTIEEKITDLNMKPAKRWDSVVTTIITVGVTSIVVFIMAKIGVSK